MIGAPHHTIDPWVDFPSRRPLGDDSYQPVLPCRMAFGAGCEAVERVSCLYSPPAITGLEVTVKKLLCLLVLAFTTLAISAPASYGCDEGSYSNQSGAGK